MNKFKKIELEIDGFVQKARQSYSYDIASRVVGLLKDANNYAEAIGIEPEDVAEHLESRFLADFPVTLTELTVIFEYHPKREQWNRPLRELYNSTVKVVGDESSTPRSQNRTKRQDLQAAQERAKSAEAEAKNLRSQLDKAVKENRRLIRENAVLEGRISELERMTHREPVGV